MSTKVTQVYELGGKEYPITDYITIDIDGTTYKNIPLVDMPMMSDYRWQMDALKSRLEHPEYYEPYEDVPHTMDVLRRWLWENAHLATPQEWCSAHELLVACCPAEVRA